MAFGGLTQWFKDRFDDLMGTNIQAGQRSINNANQQIQQQPAKYGVLANPQAKQQFVRQQARGNSFNPYMEGTKAAGNYIKSIPAGIINTAQTPYDAIRIGSAKITRNAVAEANAQKAFSSDASNNLFSPVVPFAKSVAATAMSPVSNRYAEQEAQRAERLLGRDLQGNQSPLGKNYAQIEGDVIRQDFMRDTLARGGVTPEDSLGATTRKIAGQAGAAGLTMASLGKAPTFAQAKAPQAFMKDLQVMGGLGAAQNVANAAQTDNPTGMDYLKAGLQGYAQGVALPLVIGGAAKGVRSLKDGAVPSVPVRPDRDQLPQVLPPQLAQESIPLRLSQEIPTSPTASVKLSKLSDTLPIRGNQPNNNAVLGAQVAPEALPRNLVDPARSFDVNDTTLFNSKQYVKQMTELQEAARKAGAPSGLDKASAAKEAFKTKMIDRFAPLEDTLRSAQKAGAKIEPDQNLSFQLDRVLRSEGIAQAYIKDRGLADIVQKVPNTKEFDQYLIAKHAAELGDDVATGRNSVKDAALVNSLSGKYENFAQELYRYNQELLDKSVEYGLISGEMAAQLRQKYPQYVPFNRIFPDDDMPNPQGRGGEASLSKQSVVQKIKGSQREIESPLGSIIAKTQAVIEQGERNKAASMLASYKDMPDNPFNLREIGANETIGNRHTISFLDNGKKRTFETTKQIADAAKHLNREQINIVGRAIAVPARVLRLGATGVNVPFVVSNVVKDIVGSFVNSRNAFSSSPANLPALGKALAAALHHDGKYYRELMREGVAGTSFDIMRDAPKMNVKEIRSHRNLATRAIEAAKPNNWVRGLEDTIGRSEDFGRALQYYGNKSAFKRKGYTDADAKILAADQARFNSTNFARMGEYGRAINSIVPYSNAAIQGARIGVRRIKERPIQTISKMALTVVAPSALVAANNFMDENKRKVMENIPEYEKENNIIIVGDDAYQDDQGNWHNVKKFPVPPQFIGIHNAVQRMVESKITGKDYDLGKSIGDITENYTTINPTNIRKTANNYVPQGVKLIAEPMMNRNFFTGQQIVPDAIKNLDPEDQVNKGTSGTAKVIGKMTNQSPLVVDNLIRTGAAGAGQNLVNFIDRQVLAKAGIIKEDEVRGKGISEAIKDRFSEARGRSQGALYYQTMEEAAKKLKLGGKDYQQLNALLAKSIDADGNPVGKTEKEKRAVHDILQAHPRLIEVRTEAAKQLSKQTGKPYDPLYDLSTQQQEIYHRIQSVPKNSADARDLKERNKAWLEPFMKTRSKFFEENPIEKKAENDLVEFPNVDKNTKQLVDQYFATKDSAQRAALIDANPQIGEYFNQTAKYANDVRQAQGFNPMRTYQAPSQRVQALMDARNFRDPEVAQWLQNNSIYNLTKDAAVAQIQGNDLSSKALKAANSLGRYNMVKNPDGTYALKYDDTQGSGKNYIQDGAVDLASSKYSRRGRRGRRGGRIGKVRIAKGNPGKTGPKSIVKIASASLPTGKLATAGVKIGQKKVKIAKSAPKIKKA